MDKIVVVRGGGDVSTGSIQRLHRAGFKVLVLEIPRPTSIRRTVALSEAINDGEAKVEDVIAKRIENVDEAEAVWAEGKIAMMVDPKCESIDKIKPVAVVDAIIAKKNLGTNIDMAPIVVGLGPGFVASEDVDIVIETNRGHNLGRLIFEGPASANTGNPGNIKGYTVERVLYSPGVGNIQNIKDIGDFVEQGETIATVDGKPVKAKLKGIVRGLIKHNTYVPEGFKIGDVDPRSDQIENCYTISDKARAIGGATLEAVMLMMNRKGLI